MYFRIKLRKYLIKTSAKIHLEFLILLITNYISLVHNKAGTFHRINKEVIQHSQCTKYY